MKHTLNGNIATRNIWLDGKLLSPEFSQVIRNHSPDGFCWGYGGSGPAQLALAILLELVERGVAISAYQKFKWDFIAKLPQTDFELEFKIEEIVDKGQRSYSFRFPTSLNGKLEE